MKTKRLLSIPLMLLGAATFAQTVSEEEALDKALSFLSSQQHARGNNSEARLTLAHKSANQDETYYYVFNNQAGGFVIIGGDEIADDVLGYTENGSFDIDQLPANFQIMNYHQWPEHGWLSNRYQQNGFTYEADFQNTTYDWSLMQNTYSETYTGSAAEMEVAKLMYHVGVSIGMDYGTVEAGGSSASNRTAAQKLVSNFGYKSGRFILKETRLPLTLD